MTVSRSAGLGPAAVLPSPPLLLGPIGVVVGPAVADGWEGVGIGALALAVAAGFLLDVQLPAGGRLPLGHALVIGLTELVSRAGFAFVVGAGLLVGWPLQAARLGRRGAAWTTGWLLVASAAGAGGHALGVRLTEGAEADDELRVLARVALAGAAYLVVDLLARGPLMPPGGERVRLRQAWPMEIALLCVAGLFAVLYATRGLAAAALALVPLLATRFSFERYGVARQTYAQTTQALGIVPEVAGLVPLGHAERTAVYATALTEELGLDPETATRTVTAARLHHIGHISRHDPMTGVQAPDPAELGRIGAEILEETGFLGDVAELVAAAADVDAHGPFAPVPVAIVRVASTFDDLVGDDARRARKAVVELLARHRGGTERSVATALVRLTDTRPGLVTEAIAQAAPLAAVWSHDHEEDEHEHHHAGGPGRPDDCR